MEDKEQGATYCTRTEHFNKAQQHQLLKKPPTQTSVLLVTQSIPREECVTSPMNVYVEATPKSTGVWRKYIKHKT